MQKGKGKTRGKNGKTVKCAEEHDNESTDSFQNYNSRRLLCPKSGGQRGAPPILLASQKELSFFFLWTCFPFFSFFYQRLSSAFDFSTSKQLLHEQRASTREFFKVHGVNKIWKKNVKTSPIKSGCRKKSPRGPAYVRDYDTFLVSWLVFENTSSKITHVLLKISEIFYENVRLDVWIQFGQIKEKSIFSASEGGSNLIQDDFL